MTFLAMIFATSFIPAHAQTTDIAVATPSDHSSIVTLDLPPEIDFSNLRVEITSEDNLPTVSIDGHTVQVYGLDNGVEHLVTLLYWYIEYFVMGYEDILISSISDPEKDSTTTTISGIGNLTLPNVMEYDNGVTLTGSNDFTFSGDSFVGIDGNGNDGINDGESITYDFETSTDYVLFSYSGVGNNTDLDEPLTILFEGYSNEDKIIDVIGATMPDSNMHIITNMTVPITSLTITVVYDSISYISLFADIYNTSLEENYCGELESFYNVIYGTESSDYIKGTSNADLIFGYGGNDFIRGMVGDDCIYGGDGNDFIQGDKGDDTIYGGDGDDTVRTGSGNDIVYGEDGNDILHAVYKKGSNILDGGNGDDICVPGNNKVSLSILNCEIIE